MHRRDAILAVLGAAEGRAFSPVQLQKAVFLIDRNMPDIFDEGSKFNFAPYDYGPFDRAVYVETDALTIAGLAKSETGPNGYRQYSATDEGLRIAKEKFNGLDNRKTEYINLVANWVRSLGFAQLVKSIYQEYPDMRANSIFVD